MFFYFQIFEVAFYDGIHGKDCGHFICLYYKFLQFSFRKYVIKITFHYYYRQYFEVLKLCSNVINIMKYVNERRNRIYEKFDVSAAEMLCILHMGQIIEYSLS